MAIMGLGSPVWGQLYIPPDLYGNQHQGSNILRRNDNQVVDTDQLPRPDVKYYFEGSPVGIYLRGSSRVSFTYHVLHNDSVTPDTAFRVDMTLRGAKMKVPMPVDSAPGIGDDAYWDGLDYTLPTQLPNGGPLPPDAFYQEHGMDFLASFDVTSLHMDYCTGWGQGTATAAPDFVNAAYGLDYDGQHLWMVGGTHALTLTNVDCPDPGGTGVHHTPVNSGGMDDYAKCDGFILAFDPATYQLKYGTLLGGYNYDMLLDVTHDAEQIYITGETRSTTHYTTDLDPDRYFQPLNPNGSSRDAVIIALAKNMASPTLLWQTAYGGINTERGWGIATNATEVYLTGGTASAFWDNYPLKEFDLDDDLDFFQNIHFGGNAYSFLDYWQFEYGLDGVFSTPATNPEPAQQPHDGFIASFNLQYQNTVGTTSRAAPARNLVVNPTPAEGQWAVHFPDPGDWTVTAYDAAGQKVGMWHASNTSLVVDLTARSSGLYLLVARDRAGTRYPAKIVRP